MKKAIWTIVIILVIVVAAVFGSSIFMLHYSLDPDPCRADTAVCYQRLFNTYPETRPWIDSLRRANALRDTFVTMPTGERHHALYVNRGSQKTALIIHGWRDCSIDFLFLARLYEHELGYNIVMPDLHAHGLSEGDMIQMGWFDRKDAVHWLTVFQTDTMVVHGVSMGGATTMMTSAEPLPPGIRDIHFVDDCGYTSVWDEFSGEIQNQFGLPPFPLMYTTNLLCKLWLDWSFNEASALDAVRRSPHPHAVHSRQRRHLRPHRDGPPPLCRQTLEENPLDCPRRQTRRVLPDAQRRIPPPPPQLPKRSIDPSSCRASVP